MGFDGKGSERVPRPGESCPACKQKGRVHYTGGEVLHGNPFTPASDTEVEHWYRCDGCGHEWSHLS